MIELVEYNRQLDGGLSEEKKLLKTQNAPTVIIQ
ncbi:hypothetical protein ACUXIC_001676 [Enterococcus lactis]